MYKSNFLKTVGGFGLFLTLASPVWALKSESGETLYYRYLNDKGVPVLNHSLPPEFAQKGYQVVTASGDVVREVAPALSAEETARLRTEREETERLAEWDKELRRRYSSVLDIEAAQGRKVAQVESNLAILRGNLLNLRNQIAEQQGRAAEMERLGRPVPEGLLETLAALEKEVDITEQKIEQRRQERTEIVDKFQRDIERFKVIRPAR